MSAPELHPRPIVPFAVATAGIALFSTMDALMKGLSLASGTYNALLWRTLAGAAIGGAVREPAGERRDAEPSQADHEQSTPPEQVPDSAEEDQEAPERERIGRDNPRQVSDREA